MRKSASAQVELSRTEISILINSIGESIAAFGNGDELEVRLGAEPDKVEQVRRRLERVSDSLDKKNRR